MRSVLNPELALIWSSPFWFFQFFCLISFDTTLSKKFNSRPTILILIWHICIASVLLVDIGYTFYVLIPSISNNHFELFVIVYSVEILVILLAQAICIIESLTKRSKQIKIVSSILCIVIDFAEKFQCNVDLSSVRRKTIVIVSGILFISSAACVWSLSSYPIPISFWTMLGPTIYSFQLMYVQKIHVAFYVDMIVESLNQVKNVLDNIRNEIDSKRRLQKLMVAQRIYRELVSTVALLNCTFGLSMLVVIFQNVVELLSTTYWFIVQIYYFKSISGVLSEYRHFLRLNQYNTEELSIPQICFFITFHWLLRCTT